MLDDLLRVIDQLSKHGIQQSPYEDVEDKLKSKNNYYTQKLLRLKFIMQIDDLDLTIQDWINRLVNVDTSDILQSLELTDSQKENVTIALRSLGSIIEFLLYSEIEPAVTENYTYVLHRFKFAIEHLYLV